MSDDQFTKLFKYMQESFERLEAKLDEKASQKDMERVLNFLDEIAKRQEITEDERLVIGHQLERLDRWTHELANKIGYKLSV